MAKSSRPAKTAKDRSTVRNSRPTVSGPAEPDTSGPGDILAEKAAGTQDVASAFPFNPNKAAEYDPDAALAPPEGASVKPADPIVGASTVTERNGSDKVGSGGPNIGQNPTVGPLDRVRVDSTDRALTTNHGVPVGDNQNSLKAGLRGPTLLEDFILRENCKPILAVGASEQLLTACGIDPALPDGQPDPGVITTTDASTATDAFVAAIAKHRHFARETDPPRV